MTLPIPIEMTATVGQQLTSVQWNSNVRDAINFLTLRPIFVGLNSTVLSIGNAAGAAVALTWDTNFVDTYNGHSTVTNTSRYTAQIQGWYRVTGTVSFASNTAGARGIQIFYNGTAQAFTRMDLSPGANATATALMTTGLIPMAVNDFIEIRCGQTSGGSLNTNASSSQFIVEWSRQ